MWRAPVCPANRRGVVQIEQHELARIEPKAVVCQRRVELASKGNQLSLDAPDVGQRPKRLERAGQKFIGQRQLRKTRRDVEAAQQSLVLLDYVKGITRRLAAFQGRATRQRSGLHELLNQLQRRTIIPAQFLSPALGLFSQQGLDLARAQLA